MNKELIVYYATEFIKAYIPVILGAFAIGTVLCLLFYGIFKAFSLVNIKK